MKRVKMMLYGEPGVGKSVFACHAPSPFFVTTDGNYEWLVDEFGADPDAHYSVESWADAKRLFNEIKTSPKFDKYETIVLDLTEDFYKWAEHEYCTTNGFEHISECGYGKGYEIVRDDFDIELAKLMNIDKNIILLMHEEITVVKDRRGIETHKYRPSSLLRDKVIDKLEGRVRYCLRCYAKNEENEDGTLTKKRYLSLVPKENEYGIIRGVNENEIPQDIPLDWDTFAEIIGLNYKTYDEVQEKKEVKTRRKKVEEVKEVEEAEEEVKPLDLPKEDNDAEKIEIVKEEVKSETAPIPETKDKDAMIADIKAKIAALNNKKEAK